MAGWTEADLEAYHARLRQPPVEPEKRPKRKPKPRKLKLSEAQIQKQIMDLLIAEQWLVFRTNKFFSGSAVVVQGTIEVGMPDLQARRLARYFVEIDQSGNQAGVPWDILWIEVKKPGGQCSPVQLAWHATARARGETVIVAESVEQAAEAIGAKVRG